jgi:hypothetical protein
MPSRQFTLTLAANERRNNIVEGTSFELLGDQARLVRLLAVSDPAELVELSVFFTDLQVLEPSQIQVAAAGVAPAHSRLIISARNLTAAAADFRVRISVD